MADIIIYGNTLDTESRCTHYHSSLDIIAIKMKCCNKYYACIFCHEENEDHSATVWPKSEFDTHAILCGNCKTEITITQYLKSKYECPNCTAAFNPKCSNHNHFYFEVVE